MRSRSWLALSAVGLSLLSGYGATPVAARRQSAPEPVVIAIVEVGNGLNVLHRDFAARRGQQVRPPAAATPVRLPPRGSFDQRVAAAERTLGRLRGERLYSIEGTRIVGIYSTLETYSLLDDRGHGTGTSSSAVGLTSGTAPNALLVFVPDTGREAWEWVAKQPWIDIVSSSYFTVMSDGNCPELESIRDIAEQGRLVFTAAGNQDPGWTASSPSGIPEAYQVGGVDSKGRSYAPPGDFDVAEPTSFTDNTTRPYETGDAFNREIADPDGLEGRLRAAGTSFSAPATAGRAATLIEFARELLRTPADKDPGLLATLGPGGTPPAEGPLADGDLTAAELISVLHHTAAPAEPASPARYLVEGFGAHSDATIERARAVLSGAIPEPARPEEDLVHERVEALRAHFFPEDRCS